MPDDGQRVVRASTSEAPVEEAAVFDPFGFDRHEAYPPQKDLQGFGSFDPFDSFQPFEANTTALPEFEHMTDDPFDFERRDSCAQQASVVTPNPLDPFSDEAVESAVEEEPHEVGEKLPPYVGVLQVEFERRHARLPEQQQDDRAVLARLSHEVYYEDAGAILEAEHEREGSRILNLGHSLDRVRSVRAWRPIAARFVCLRVNSRPRPRAVRRRRVATRRGPPSGDSDPHTSRPVAPLALGGRA